MRSHTKPFFFRVHAREYLRFAPCAHLFRGVRSVSITAAGRLSPAMALHGTTKAHSVRIFKQTLATRRPGGDGSRTAGGSCRRPHHRCCRGHHRSGRTRPTHRPRTRRCASVRNQHSRRAVSRRADEAISPTHPPARACGCPRRGHRGAHLPPRHLHGPRRPTSRPAGDRTARRAR